MVERYRAISHKSVKQLIAAGDYELAENILHGERASLLAMLRYTDCDRELAELRLTRNSSLLAELYTEWGKAENADKWFRKALKHTPRLKDPMVRERILRVRGMYFASVGRYEMAEADLSSVITTLESAKFILECGLPNSRIKLELAFTRSRLAQCMLLRNPDNHDAIDTLMAMRSVLSEGNKPRYELENLMALVAVTPWTSPLLQRSIIAKALYLNTRHARNTEYFIRLADASMPVPAASFLHRAAGRIVR